MPQEIIQNVVIFGETGAGKSSLVNMILGHDEAKISGDARGCTFDSTVYRVKIKGRLYNLHDTIGLGDHSNSRLDVTKPIGNLYNLLTLLSKTGGIHLLVFVVRCGRLTQTVHKNYTLFYQGFCNAQVPIVIVVTGCEDVEPRMETWWAKNERFFTKAGMRFRGHACICASKGRETAYGYVNEDLVEESKGLVDDLISRYCQSNGMKKEPSDWFHTVCGFVDLFRSRRIPSNILSPSASVQRPPPRGLYDASTDSTTTREATLNASLLSVEAQVDGNFVPNMRDVLLSPEAQDSSAALPLSNSSTKGQNALQSGARTHTSLPPLPSQEGIPCSTMATRAEVGQPTTLEPLTNSVTSSVVGKAKQSAIPHPAIGPENRSTAMTYPPSVPNAQSIFCPDSNVDPICLIDLSDTSPSSSPLPSPPSIPASPASVQLPPACELYDNAENAPTDSTNTREAASNASPPSIEAQVDGKLSPNTGDELISYSHPAPAYTRPGDTATEEYIMRVHADSAALAQAQAQTQCQQQKLQQAAKRRQPAPSNPTPPPSPKMPGAYPITSSKDAPVQFHSKSRQVYQNHMSSPPPKARRNFCSRTTLSRDTPSFFSAPSADPVQLNAHRNWSNTGPLPEARSLFDSTVIPPSPFVRGVVPLDTHQNNPTSSFLRQLKGQNVVPWNIGQNNPSSSFLRQLNELGVIGPAFISLQGEMLSASNLDLQNVYQHTHPSSIPPIQTGRIAKSVVPTSVNVDKRASLPSVSGLEPHHKKGQFKYCNCGQGVNYSKDL